MFQLTVLALGQISFKKLGALNAYSGTSFRHLSFQANGVAGFS